MKKVLVIPIFLLFLSWSNEVIGQIPRFTRLDDCRITEDLGNSQGSSLADFDNDGDIDLLIGNTSGSGTMKPVLLYKNERGGYFTRILTGDLATQYQAANMPTATCVDIDNDGDWDVSTPCVFYMNDGYGVFKKQFMPAVGESCGDQVTSWVDIDNDGDLDCSIWSQMNTPNQFFLNNGDGTFGAILEGPFVTTPLSTEALSWADMDNDGDMDAFAANFSFSSYDEADNVNVCFENLDGTLALMGGVEGLLLDSLGSSGASWGDYDNDGDLDVYVSAIRGTCHLYRNEGNKVFTQLMINPPEATDIGFMGSDWGDFDNDGDLDLIVTSDPNDLLPLADFSNFNMLFMNNGDGTFTEVATGELKDDGGHSCSLLDYDNDGDLDILMPNGSLGDPMINYIYSNDGNDNHWININCRGTLSNASAIGTRIYAKAEINGKRITQMRELGQQTGLHSISSPRFHFGLGDAEIVDTLIICWPSGEVDTNYHVEADQFFKAVENSELELDLSASNYIEYVPAIEELDCNAGSETIINLTDHYRLVTGDSVPEGAATTLSYTLHEDEDPDVLTASLDGSELSLQAGHTEGSVAVKLEASAAGFRERIDFIVVNVDDPGQINKQSGNPIPFVYPNPVIDQLTVEFPQGLSHSQIQIFDITGKMLFTEIPDYEVYSLNLSSLKDGLYFIRIIYGDYTVTEKMVKVE